MEEGGQKKENVKKRQEQQAKKTNQKTQISYKPKLVGHEERAFEIDLEEQMKEWLKEEIETTPPLTKSRKQMFEALPTLNMSDERLKELCRPWKDALILSLLGKKINVRMMKDSFLVAQVK